MRNIVVLLALAIFSVGAVAQQPVPYGALLFEGRLDDTVGGVEKQVRRHVYIAGGLRWDQIHWRSELGFSNESSGEGFVEIQVNTYEWINWALYVFNPGSPYLVYGGAGLGVSSHYVKTTAGGASRTDPTDVKMDVGAAFGIETVWSNNIQAAVEIRAYKLGEKKDPITSGLLQIGYLFQ